MFTVDGGGAWDSGTALPIPAQVVANWKFGTSLSYSPTADGGTGGQLAVGVPSAKLDGSGTAGTDCGRVYIYSNSGGWSTATSTILTDVGIVAGDKLGESVVMIGNEVYASAPGTAERRGAVYLFKYDTSAWSLAAIFDDGEAANNDRRFGTSIAVSGNRMMIGATNGHDDDGTIDPVIKLAGAAYVFERTDATAAWSQTAKLQLTNPQSLSTFGSSVALNGDTAVIGAPGTPGTGQALYRMGKAYVFSYDGSSWSLANTLIPSDGASSDTFGKAIAIDGDYALVGSPAHDDSGTSTTNVGGVYMYHLPTLNMPSVAINIPVEGPFVFADLVDGDMTLTADATPSGSSTITSVEFFVDGTSIGTGTLNGGSYDITWSDVTWAQHELQVRTVTNENIAALSEPITVYATQSPRFDEQRLIANDGTSWDLFGYAVDVTVDNATGNEYAIVGAHGDQANGERAGSAYLFEKVDGTWTQVQKLTGPDADKYWEGFGFAVAIHGDKAYVGVTQDQTDEGSNKGPGTVYVYQRSTGTPGSPNLWQALGSPLVAWDGNTEGSFGQAIAVNGTTLAIGAPEDDVSTEITDAGAVYVFTWSGSAWTQNTKLTTASGGGDARTKDDGFGLSIAIDYTHLIVGCPGDDDDVNTITDSGKAYVYALSDLSSNAILTPDDFATDESQPNAHFGESVAIHSGLAVIGSASATITTNAEGKAYVAKLTDTNTWSALQVLTADDASEDDSFGVSVAIHDALIAVGSFFDDDNASNTGSVYLYQQPGIDTATGTLTDQFTQITKFGATDASPDATFGIALAISENEIAVGNMLNSTQAQNAGSAYIFRKPKAPTIAITSPTPGSQVENNTDVPVTVQVTLNDETAITTPTLWAGNIQLTNPTDNGDETYTFNWHTPSTDQTLTLKAVATNTESMSATTSIDVQVEPAGVAPVVAMTLPTSGSTVKAGQNITLQASATDSDGSIAFVQFYANGTLAGQGTAVGNNVYELVWTAPTSLVGNVDLTAIATDSQGLTSVSNTRTLTIQANSIPVITWLNPAAGTSFSPGNTITLSASASDPDGSISSVVFYRGAIPIGLGQYDSGDDAYTFNWNNVDAGSYELSAIATDSSGATIQSSKIQITVKLVPIEGLALWLTTDQGVQTDENGYVGTWEDQSGHGRHVTEAVTSKQPLLVENQANHRPVVRFDGVDDELSHVLATSYTGPSSVIVVARLSNLTQSQDAAVFSTDSSESAGSFQISLDGQSPGLWQLKQDAVASHTIATSNSSFVMLSAVIDQQDILFYENGNLVDTASIANADFKQMVSYLLGRNRVGDAYLACDLVQVLVYQRALETDELDQIHQTFEDRYDIGQDTLASGNTSATKNGCDWLSTHQNDDGSWSGDGQALVDTLEAFRTLVSINCGTDALNKALPYISTWTDQDLYSLSRKALALSYSTAEITDMATTLINAQAANGGWGLGEKKQSDPMDTMVVIETLLLTSSDQIEVLTAARDYLMQAQLEDGSWGYAGEESQSDIVRTAIGLIVLDQLKAKGLTNDATGDVMDKAQAYLESKQSSDGSFGSISETAWSYLALVEFKQPTDLQTTLSLLQNTQLSDGSWDENVYDTAIALRALGAAQPPSTESLPDLSLEANGLTFDPAAAESGITVTLSAIVFNTGSVEADDITVEFFNGDPRLGGTAIGQPQIIANIPAGGSANTSISYDTTGLLETQQIVVFVDRANTINESSEINNVASRLLPINADPDLVITSQDITVSNATPQAFERFTLQAQIHNAGGSFVDSFVVRVLDNGEQLAQTQFPGLSAGSSTTLMLTLGLPSGLRTLSVEIDPDASLTAETNRTNNAASMDVTVAALPSSPADLVVTSLNVSPAVATDAQEVTVTLAVSNQGGDAAGSSFDVELLSNGSNEHTFNLADLAGGQRAILTYNIAAGALPAGDYTFKAVVDPSDAITEQVETNNERSADLTIVSTATPAELVFDSLVVSPSSVDEGLPVSIIGTVTNTGTTVADNVLIRFYDSSEQLGKDILLPTLAGGSSAVIQMEAVFEPGQRTLIGKVDPEGQIAEDDENNNQAYASLRVKATTGLPDLQIAASDLTLSNATPQAFEAIDITARINNIGENVAENIVVRFMDNGELLADLNLSGVNVGRSNTATLRTSLPSGEHALSVVIDPVDTIAESNESNNTTSLAVTVTGPSASQPDLQIESITATPTAPIANENVDVKLSLINTGGAITGSSVDITIADNSNVLHTFTLTDIGEGQRVNLTLTTTLAEGSHAIAAVADANGAVSESDETNNTQQLSLSVPTTATPPDLVISELTVSPGALNAGDAATVLVTVQNAGTQDAENVTVRLTNNGLPMGSDLSVAQLYGGQSASFQIQTAFTAGTKQIQATADPDNAVGESNETNNTLATSISVIGIARPDLAITASDMTSSHSLPKPGSTITLTLAVHNVGDLASDPVNVLLTQGDPFAGGAILIDTVAVPAIAAGQSIDVTAQWTVPMEQSSIYAYVDSDQILTELDEDNNLAYIIQKTAPLPDLVVSGGCIAFSHTDLGQNTTVQITGRVDNLSTVSASDVPVIVAERIDGQLYLIGSSTLDYIAAGASEQVAFVWRATGGEHEIVLIADPDQTVLESNENNNEQSATVFMTSPGVLLRLYQVDNDGQENLTETFHAYETQKIRVVHGWENPQFHFTVVNNDTGLLAAGTHVNFVDIPEFTWDTIGYPPGEYTVTARLVNADSFNYVQSSSIEVLNTVTTTFTIAPSIGARTSVVRVSPQTVVAGKIHTVAISALVAGGSNIAATYDVNWRILDPDDLEVTSGSTQVELPEPLEQDSMDITLGEPEVIFSKQGQYRVVMSVSREGEQLTTSVATIDAVQGLRLIIERTVTPKTVSAGPEKSVHVNINVKAVEDE